MRRSLFLVLVLCVLCLIASADQKPVTNTAKPKPLRPEPPSTMQKPLPQNFPVTTPAAPSQLSHSIPDLDSQRMTSAATQGENLRKAPEPNPVQDELNALVQQRKELELRGENLKVIDGKILQVLAQIRGPREPGNPLDQGSDACPATVIPSIPYTDNGTTGGYTNDYTPSCASSTAPDVVYQYTPAVTGMHTVSLCGSGFDTVLEIRYGGGCPGATVFACNDDACGLQSQITASLSSGVTYYIIVDGFGNFSGGYTLNVTGPAPVGPDVCPGTTITSLPYTDTQNTSGMANNYTPGCGSSAAPDAVYTFAPTVSGTYTVSLCGSGFDTILDVRTGGSCPGSTSVACNDDYCSLQSQVTPYLSAGTTYYILVDGYSTYSGSYTLNVSRQVPQGDDCTNPLPMSLPFYGTGSTCGFANDYDYACNWSSSSSDVVYSYANPPEYPNLMATFSLCRSNYDTKLYIYQGSCSGTPIACSDDATTCPCAASPFRSFIECVALSAPSTYYIVVDGYGGACGDYVLMAAACPDGDITQQPGDIVEVAENCGDPNFAANDPDGGCNSTPHQWAAINSGQTIFGRVFDYVGPFGDHRDTDWYVLPPLNNDSLIVTVQGEIYLQLNLMDTTSCSMHEYQYVSPFGSQVVRWAPSPGSNYALWVSLQYFGSAPVPRDYRLSLQIIHNPPPNDNCANAIPLTVNASTPTCGTTVGATLDCGQSVPPEVWYSFTLSQCMHAAIEFCGTGGIFSLSPELYASSCCGQNLIVFNWEMTSCADGSPTMHYDLPVGQYFFPVRRSPAGPFCVRVTGVAGPPANDQCANAYYMPINAWSHGATTCATLDNVPACPWTPTAPGLWYSTVGTGHILHASTCEWTTYFDTRLSVFTCDCSHLACVAGNDDSPCAGRPLSSHVSWCSMPGEEYLILVQGTAGQTGKFFFTVADSGVACSSPVCCPDQTLTAPGQVSGTTVGAGNDCNLWGTTSGEDATVRVTIPTSSTWTFSLCGTQEMPGPGQRLWLGTYCCTGDLDTSVMVSCVPPLASSYAIPCIALSAGTYYATIDAMTGYEGPYVLTVSQTTSLDPASLVGPANGAQVMSGASQDYCWQPVANASVFRIQWDDDSQFGSPVAATTPSTCYTQTLNAPLGTWYWRVRAENSCSTGPWSASRTVQLITLNPPVVVARADGVQLRLYWNPVGFATSYDVQSSTNPSTGFSLLTTTTDTTITTSYSAQDKLFYRVIAKRN